MNNWTLILIVNLLASHLVFAQYPPPAGQPGTTAMYKDSTAFRSWANGCTVLPGYINFVDTTVVDMGSNRVTYGFPEDAAGPPDNMVISLGDRGVATLTLEAPMFDSTGPDFAVFENGWSDDFLELGYVEVSSNGIDFVRFPSNSLIQDTVQVATFGTIDARRINNLAGKYRFFFGTPFDLHELMDSAAVDISSVTHIRIIDVGGCILPGYQSFDSQGHVINDPWPTPFWSSGIDVDAVGIIHQRVQSVGSYDNAVSIRIFPNPASHILYVNHSLPLPVRLSVTDPLGRVYLSDKPVAGRHTLDVSDYPPGLYILQFILPDGKKTNRTFIKQ